MNYSLKETKTNKKPHKNISKMDAYVYENKV